jgi:hypothetical protein
MIKQEIIEIQGKLFQVKRKFPQHRINLEKGNVVDLKIFFHCDTIFKSQGLIWFCNEIKDINYEEIN